MKNKLRKIAYSICIALLLFQLYQPTRNIDDGKKFSTHFERVYNTPPYIANLFQNACYDCHSNNTNYRWFDYIQPARLFVENHITNAKKQINFSEWGSYNFRRQQSKLNRIVNEIEANEMPLSSYTAVHKNAILTDSQKLILINWLNTLTIKNNE